jgi:hypothetical protein
LLITDGAKPRFRSAWTPNGLGTLRVGT